MELPIRLLLAVVVLMFTIAAGYNALDAHRAIEEESAAANALSEILLKARMVGMGGVGAREIVTFEIKGGTKLTLRNEDFNGSINGIVDAELSTGGRLLKVLSLPLWDSTGSPTSADFLKTEKVFLGGSHKISFTHISQGASDNSNGNRYLLVR